MTCSGGDSAQGADEAAKLGVGLPALRPATLERLTALLPSAATAANPLDYTSMIWGDVDALAGLVQTMGADPAIDVVLVFYDQPDRTHRCRRRVVGRGVRGHSARRGPQRRGHARLLHAA